MRSNANNKYILTVLRILILIFMLVVAIVHGDISTKYCCYL